MQRKITVSLISPVNKIVTSKSSCDNSLNYSKLELPFCCTILIYAKRYVSNHLSLILDQTSRGVNENIPIPFHNCLLGEMELMMMMIFTNNQSSCLLFQYFITRISATSGIQDKLFSSGGCKLADKKSALDTLSTI